MTKARRRLKFLLTVAILLIAPVQAHAEPPKIRLGYVVPVTNLASILFAKDGLAKHNGKTYVVDVIRHQASTTQIIALDNGELDIALLGFTSLPLAIENARMDDLRAIVGELRDGAPGYYSNEFAVVADGPVRKVEDLKGKVLATNAQGSAVDVGMRARLRMSGLESKRDYTIIEAQFSAMRAMLGEHKADLVPNVPPFSMHPDMLKIARTLFTQADGIGVGELGLWVARADFIAKNRAVLTDFLEDYLRMVRFYTDPANHDEAVGIAANYMKLPASIFDAWLFTKRDYYRDPAGGIDVVALQRTYDVQKELGFLKSSIQAGATSTSLRQVRSTLQRRHEATDGFNRIRKRRTFDPGCSSPWVSSAAASGASKPKWMTKCPWLAFAEGGGEAGVCDGIVRERA